MDTLNSRLEEANSAMSASETHSDKTASDDEDYKDNIPYFDEAHNNNNNASTSSTSATLQRQSGSSYEMLSRSLDTDDDDPHNYGYLTWDNDDGDGDGDDNISNMGSEYGSFYATSPSGMSTHGASSTSAAFACSQDSASSSSAAAAAARQLKYRPDKEMLLQPPPASAALQYNYSYPPAQSARHVPHGASPYPSFGPPTHHMHGSQMQYGGSAGAYTPPAQPAFHPNMWHPNAPYGTGGGGGGGGGYGYYGAYGPQRYSPYGSRYHPQDPMIDMLQLSNSGREARNRAEKNRRDKLNGSIQELSTMVPHVAESPRRVDKTAVLRFAAHGLRLQYVFGESLNQARPQVTDSLMKLLDSFFVTLTCHGQIVLISSSIEQHLGHCQADLYGLNILQITHPEDRSMLKQMLVPTGLEDLFDALSDDENGEPRTRTLAEEEYIDDKLREDKRNFTVRLARAGPRSEPTAYELVKFDGSFRRSDEAPRCVKNTNLPSNLPLIRRTRGRDDAIPLHTISGNDIVLVALARIVRPPKVINRIVENSLEYKTRHLIDGRIIDCDMRIGIVAGYMTDEVRNLSPFTFMHQDDVRWVIVALRQMYDCNSSYGESTYRLLTRNGNFIYLQSKGYLEVDKASNKVHSFVCINTLLGEEEGRQGVQEMKKKFSIIINTSIPQSSIDAPASDNPQQLEKAVLCLIQNLQKTTPDDEDEDNDATSSGYASGAAEALRGELRHKIMPDHTAASLNARSSKTPPLALVPPETASVKTSISKSVSVVNVTAGKNFRGHQRVRSPMSAHSDDGGCSELRYAFDVPTPLTEQDCTCQLRDGDCKYCKAVAARNQQLETATTSATAMKRTISCCSTEEEEEQLKMTKRRLQSTEIEQVLTSSLDQIGRTLDQQLNAAKELRDQGNLYEVPHSSERIDEIMEEHQKQSELYVNIKSEYEVQLQSKAVDANTTNTCAINTPINSPTEPQTNTDLKPR